MDKAQSRSQGEVGAAADTPIAPDAHHPSWSPARSRRWVSIGSLTVLTLDFTQQALGHFGLPIRPVGQRTSDINSWRRFIGHAFTLGMGAVSIWRYGGANPAVWPLLHEIPAQVPVQPRSQGGPQVAAVRSVAPPAQTSAVQAPLPAPGAQDKSQPNKPVAQEKAQSASPAPITIANWPSPRLSAGAAALQRPAGWPLGIPGLGSLR